VAISASLGQSIGDVGAAWAFNVCQCLFAQIRPILEPSWATLFKAIWDLCWAILGVFWGILGPCWAILEPSGARMAWNQGRSATESLWPGERGPKTPHGEPSRDLPKELCSISLVFLVLRNNHVGSRRSAERPADLCFLVMVSGAPKLQQNHQFDI
jgi:hypothetical protein